MQFQIDFAMLNVKGKLRNAAKGKDVFQSDSECIVGDPFQTYLPIREKRHPVIPGIV